MISKTLLPIFVLLCSTEVSFCNFSNFLTNASPKDVDRNRITAVVQYDDPYNAQNGNSNDVQSDVFNSAKYVVYPLNDVRYDARDNVTNDVSEVKILSRKKRNFGGPEAINFPLVYNSVFGVQGWLASGIEVLQDIIFHVSGYTVLGN